MKKVRMTLRLGESVHQWLKEQAGIEGRSLTGHINELLKEVKERQDKQNA